jgi:hypothetical protein
MPSSDTIKSLALAILIGVGAGLLVALVGSFVGFTSRMMAGAVAGSTGAVTAIAATNLRRRRRSPSE